MRELAGHSAYRRAGRAQSPVTLIDHILERYHAVHREQLPELIRMARRVEAVHRDHPLVPTGLADLLEEAEQDLLSHMMKEENILFPMLQSRWKSLCVATHRRDARRAHPARGHA
jgi:regulator of cell morphogenesis and NO signaling